jgi:hypothetical protein
MEVYLGKAAIVRWVLRGKLKNIAGVQRKLNEANWHCQEAIKGNPFGGENLQVEFKSDLKCLQIAI